MTINFFRGKDKKPRKRRISLGLRSKRRENIATSTLGRIKSLLTGKARKTENIKSQILKQITDSKGKENQSVVGKVKEVLTKPILKPKDKSTGKTVFKHIPIPQAKPVNPLLIAGGTIGGAALLGGAAYGGYRLGTRPRIEKTVEEK